MSNTEIERPTSLRLWPGLVFAALQLLFVFVLPLVAPAATLYFMLGGVACSLLTLVWWTFFSRLPRVERFGVILLMIVVIFATRFALHESVRGAGMGMLFNVYAVMTVSVALAAAALVGSRLSQRGRRAVLAASVLVACGAWTLLRTGGITGDADSDLAWRWSKTAEEKLLAGGGEERASLLPSSSAAETGAEWPGFRGAERDGVARGAKIATDWKAAPPIELWRRAVGPGWSSFAVRGERLYTQEQRGGEELVSCYDVKTGRPVWSHRDEARFYESNGGAGPRATPTLSGNRLYTLGATGILNALDARDGSVVWTRNVGEDTETKVPGWGFSGSPLVVGDAVVVAAAGTLAAYNVADGGRRWVGPKAGCCYSSPHRVTLGGVEQIVLMNGPGVVGVSPADGKLLWEHKLPTGGRIIQPAMTADGDLLLSVGEGSDLHRVAVAQRDGAWKVEERWTSEGLKPYFSDFVVHEGHAYGFDNGQIACIDLKDGARKWAGGSYGSGQLVLVPEQDALVIVSEKGELALVGAAPERFAELARSPAIKGKTWNHPVLAGDVLLVRNSEEMAAFRLAKQAR